MEGSCESEEDKARNKHPNQWDFTTLLLSTKQEIADASLNIKA